tara:strand:+ start:1101 stop:1241 length:141 start_codon:yes stop_codon:yes gene_type:complete
MDHCQLHPIYQRFEKKFFENEKAVKKSARVLKINVSGAVTIDHGAL